MTNWLEPADFKAKQVNHQLNLIDTAIRDLIITHRDRIKRLSITESVTEAEMSMRRAIFALIEERNSRARNSGRAAEQNMALEYQARLLEAGQDGTTECLPPLLED